MGKIVRIRGTLAMEKISIVFRIYGLIWVLQAVFERGSGYMICEVFTAVSIAINAVWDVTSCSLIDDSLSSYTYLFARNYFVSAAESSTPVINIQLYSEFSSTCF